MTSPGSFYSRNQLRIELSLIFLLNLFLKGLFISEADIGGDESFSVYYAQLPISKIIEILSRGNNPPLHEIILHFWIKLFGISELAFRFPSFLFSCLATIPLYLIGERFIARGVGVTAVLLFSFSNYGLFVAHDARVYDLVLLLSCLSFFTFLTIYHRRQSVGLWVLLLLLNTALIYSHYLSAWVIIVQGLAVSLNTELRKKMLFPFLLQGMGMVVLFLPFLPVVFSRFLDSGLHGTWVSEVQGPADFYNMLWTFSNKPVVTIVFISIILLATLLVIFWGDGRKVLRFGLFSVLLWAWVPLIVSFILSFRNGFFMDKYMFFTSAGYYLTVASAALYCGKRLLSGFPYAFSCLCIILMASTFSLHSIWSKYAGGKGKISLVAKKIEELNDGNTAIYFSPDWFDKDLVYYLDRNMFRTYFEESDSDVVFRKALVSRNIYPVKSQSEVRIAGGAKRLVYVDNSADFHFPGNGILEQLRGELIQKDSFHFGNNVVVYLFSVR